MVTFFLRTLCVSLVFVMAIYTPLGMPGPLPMRATAVCCLCNEVKEVDKWGFSIKMRHRIRDHYHSMLIWCKMCNEKNIWKKGEARRRRKIHHHTCVGCWECHWKGRGPPAYWVGPVAAPATPVAKDVDSWFTFPDPSLKDVGYECPRCGAWKEYGKDCPKCGYPTTGTICISVVDAKSS